MRAKFAQEVYGIVNEVNGESVVLSGLAPATPASLLVTQSGSVLFVSDMYTDGRIRATVVSGAPRARERALVLHQQTFVQAGVGLLGRVIDPLGRTVDGRDPVPSAMLPRRQPLFAGAPGLLDRESGGLATLHTGVKAIDAFYPVLRGNSVAITGERGAGKGALALDIISHVARCNAASGDFDQGGRVRCVYVSVGRSQQHAAAAIRHLGRHGAFSDTVVIAAPDSAPVGMRNLAPFAGAAVAEAFRDSGGHALLVVDSITAHAEAARRYGGATVAC